MGHLNLAPLVDKTAAYTIEYVWLAELEIDINSVKNTLSPIFFACSGDMWGSIGLEIKEAGASSRKKRIVGDLLSV